MCDAAMEDAPDPDADDEPPKPDGEPEHVSDGPGGTAEVYELPDGRFGVWLNGEFIGDYATKGEAAAVADAEADKPAPDAPTPGRI